MGSAGAGIDSQLRLGETLEQPGVQRHAGRGAAPNLEPSHLGAGVFQLGEGRTGSRRIDSHALDEGASSRQSLTERIHRAAPSRLATQPVELCQCLITVVQGIERRSE